MNREWSFVYTLDSCTSRAVRLATVALHRFWLCRSFCLWTVDLLSVLNPVRIGVCRRSAKELSVEFCQNRQSLWTTIIRWLCWYTWSQTCEETHWRTLSEASSNQSRIQLVSADNTVTGQKTYCSGVLNEFLYVCVQQMRFAWFSWASHEEKAGTIWVLSVNVLEWKHVVCDELACSLVMTYRGPV
jgi:hypothetical protein